MLDVPTRATTDQVARRAVEMSRDRVVAKERAGQHPEAERTIQPALMLQRNADWPIAPVRGRKPFVIPALHPLHAKPVPARRVIHARSHPWRLVRLPLRVSRRE